MKAIGLFFWILHGVQVQCHRLPGYSEGRGGQGDDSPSEHQHGNELQDWHKIVPSNAEFAFRLYRQIAADPAAKNILFSPLSISTSLAALALGANSETRTQIYKGLAFDLSETEENEIHRGFHQLSRMLNPPVSRYAETGNALFIDKTVKIQPTFLENIKIFYEAEHFLTNFLNSTVAENQINHYVRKKTDRQIPHIVKDLSTDTLMVIVNYIFFQGKWGNPFHSRSTMEDIFFVDANTTVNITQMYHRAEYGFLYDEDLFCWVIEMPFEGEDAVAWFILPDEGKLSHVESTLEKETLSKWSTSFVPREIDLYIPKMSLSGSHNLKDFLQQLGITHLFNQRADLSGITTGHSLKVFEAFHKTVLQVIEEDTVLVGSSGPAGWRHILVNVHRPSPSPPPPPPTMKFNKPFLMLLIDKTSQSILLMGKVVNPMS